MTRPPRDPDPAFRVELAPAYPPPDRVVAAQAEPAPPDAADLALASTFEDDRVHDGRTEAELEAEEREAALAEADVAILATAVLLHEAHHPGDAPGHDHDPGDAGFSHPSD